MYLCRNTHFSDREIKSMLENARDFTTRKIRFRQKTNKEKPFTFTCFHRREAPVFWITFWRNRCEAPISQKNAKTFLFLEKIVFFVFF